MLIWLALFIPILATLLMWQFWRHKVVWWEFIIPFATSLILVGICKFAFSHSQTRDVEYWGGWVTKAEYYEDWNEYIHRTCYRQSCSGTGNNRTCTSIPYDCSYVDYHPEYWRATDSNGQGHRLTKGFWNSLCGQFQVKPVFVDLRRNYHTNDGDKYVCKFKGEYELLEPVTTIHSYENRVQAAKSVYNFEEIDEEQIAQYGLHPYPETRKRLTYTPVILSKKLIPGQQTWEGRFQKLNALYGARYEVRVWVLLFHNQPLEASLKQEALWKGGNKNEIVITIGLDNDSKVQWARVFSWTEKEAVKVALRNNLIERAKKGEPLNLEALHFDTINVIESYWERKKFEDFSYLTVEPPMWSVILTFFLVLGVNIGTSAFVILNPIDEASEARRKRWKRRR